MALNLAFYCLPQFCSSHVALISSCPVPPLLVRPTCKASRSWSWTGHRDDTHAHAHSAPHRRLSQSRPATACLYLGGSHFEWPCAHHISKRQPRTNPHTPYDRANDPTQHFLLHSLCPWFCCVTSAIYPPRLACCVSLLICSLAITGQNAFWAHADDAVESHTQCLRIRQPQQQRRAITCNTLFSPSTRPEAAFRPPTNPVNPGFIDLTRFAQWVSSVSCVSVTLASSDHGLLPSVDVPPLVEPLSPNSLVPLGQSFGARCWSM